MEKMYHVGFDDSHGAKYAILPGDPGRVEKIAAYLEEPRFYCQNREYTTWLGKLEGEPVLVMSTGMGGPSTAIGVEELYQTGVRTLVRIGTCGGMATPVMGGDLVVANAAIRMEGTSKEYVPLEFPAVSNIEVTNALVAAGKALGVTTHCGVVQCKDSFYGQHSPERMPMGEELMSKWRSWIMAGCLASEMESAALFIVASYLHVRTGSCFLVVANQEREKLGLENPVVHDTDMAIQVAVEAIRSLIAADSVSAELE